MERVNKCELAFVKNLSEKPHVMVDDVMAAQNSRIPQKLLKDFLVIRMKYRAVRPDGANIMNPQILDADLQINENNPTIQCFFSVHTN